MRKKLLGFAALLSFAIFFTSFTNIKSERLKSPKTCYNYVTVYASGVTIVRVQINSTSTIVNIPPGGHHDFTDPSYVQGASLTVSVFLLGQSAAPRMNSLGVDDPFQCIEYTNATQGSITSVKQCAAMIVEAAHYPHCP